MKNQKKQPKLITCKDIITTSDAIMSIIKNKLDGTMDIAEIVIEECKHRIYIEKKLRDSNSSNF
ncbi:MAG: hypothetical protein ACLQBQ_05485 [Smithella sp.]